MKLSTALLGVLLIAACESTSSDPVVNTTPDVVSPDTPSPDAADAAQPLEVSPTLDSSPDGQAEDALSADTVLPLEEVAEAADVPVAPLDVPEPPDVPEQPDTALSDAEETTESDTLQPAGCGEGKLAPVIPDLEVVALLQEVSTDASVVFEFDSLGTAGYLLPARAGAEVTIAAEGATAADDLAVWVFGPGIKAVFSAPPLASNDDSDGCDPSVTFTVPKDGHYFVVVSPAAGPGAGSGTLSISCVGDTCAAPAVGWGPCPAPVVTSIVACMKDLLPEPDYLMEDLWTALDLCDDAEPLAHPFDALCATTAPPIFCGASYEVFALQLGEASCSEQAFQAWYATDCLFGSRFQDLFESKNLVVAQEQWLTSPAGLSELEAAQLVAALVAAGFADTTTAAEVFAAVDAGQVRRVFFVDVAGRPYTAVEFGLGDNSYGAIFERAGTAVMARIQDGDLSLCVVAPGLVGALCMDDTDCGELSCEGVYEGFGRCVVTAPAQSDGSPCGPAPATPCPDALVCAGLTKMAEGSCVPPWMFGQFAEVPYLSIPDAPGPAAEAMIRVQGLGTVDMDVHLKAVIRHYSSSQLVVTLRNPAGTEVVVFAQESDVQDLTLDMVVFGFPGDESVNGDWVLLVHDVSKGGVGWIESVTLELSSRWD